MTEEHKANWWPEVHYDYTPRQRLIVTLPADDAEPSWYVIQGPPPAHQKRSRRGKPRVTWGKTW